MIPRSGSGVQGLVLGRRRWMPERAPRPDLVLTVGLVGLLVAIAVLTAVDQARAARNPNADIDRYWQLVTGHGLPDRDFDVEYPPLTWLVLRGLALLAHDRAAFGSAVVGLEAALDIAVALLLWRGFGIRAAVAYLVVSTFLLNVVDLRIDMVAVLPATLGVVAWRRGHPVVAGVALALGGAAKLWPAVLLPLLIAMDQSRSQRRRLALSGVATGGLILVGWLLLGGWNGIHEVVTSRGANGWQIESLGGSVLHIAGSASREEAGAIRTGTVPSALGVLLPAAGVLIALGIAWRAGRRGHLGAGWLGAVGALMVTNPVLSPQFLVWLAPGAALALVEGDAVLAALVVVCVVTTAGWRGVDAHAWLPAGLAAVPAAVLLVRAGRPGAAILAAAALLSVRALGDHAASLAAGAQPEGALLMLRNAVLVVLVVAAAARTSTSRAWTRRQALDRDEVARMRGRAAGAEVTQ